MTGWSEPEGGPGPSTARALHHGRPMPASAVAPARTSRPETFLLATALAILVLLAWGYVWSGAGAGMSALELTTLALFPHRLGSSMPGMDAMPFSWPGAIAMWWVMMIAMMTPGATPLVLLHARTWRRAQAAPAALPRIARALLLAGGYLAVWLAFSVGAAALQSLLEPSGLLSPMMLWSRSAPLSAAVLACAGLYQLSPLKQRCLSKCRSPIAFIAQHWQPGSLGAFMMGIRHGAWCVGCCAPLMALLFVGGLMNLAWIAALTLLVLAEKLAPHGPWVGRGAGVLLLIWAGATLVA
jgi:predicted metal-binding membrane protein